MTIPLSASRLHLLCASVAMLALHSCIPEPACAATPLQLRWTAELSDPKPYQAVLFAGESADLQATLKLYGRSIVLEDTATASLYWQTNGMASAWWSVPATVTTAGVVTASWTPAMDAGADLYRWHIGVANAASSTVYRAFGAFRMQPSPGAAPNILDLPVRWIDFDLVAISNAPWATPADVAAATSGVSVAESDPVAYPVATNALALASTALQPGATNGMLTAEADTLATVTARGATTLSAITARNFIGGRYGAGAGESTSGEAWGAYGNGAGFNANGNDWGAYGQNAGAFASGNAWVAYGFGAGELANGSYWGAYGQNAGCRADHNNSHAFGYWAGFAARGDSRLYIDVYAAEPGYAANGAINDRIFGDTDGKLYLGRGEGAPGGAVGGTLRGPWTGGGFASYLAATNIAAAAVAGSGHAMAEQVVSGAVGTASAGNRYFWTSATNVVLSVNLTSGQVVNYAALRNTATNAITATASTPGWTWTGGQMTNSIPAGKTMTFGWACDPATGTTNAYATGVSK